MRQNENGQVVPLVAIAILVIMGMALLGAKLAGEAATLAKAQTAADATALAGVEAGRTAAVVAARANSGTLEDFQVNGADVIVRVRVGEQEAQARASGAAD